MINKKQFTCTKNGRLDEILAEHLQLSRSQAQKYIKQGVEIDGKKISKSGCSIKEGQVVTFYSLEIKEEEKPDLDIVPYKTIYEDNDILVINKPRGLVVHPSAGHKNDTLVNYLVHHYKTLSKQMEDENTDRPGIIHRIDKDTSGLLVIAKTPKSYISLAEQVANHSIDREYICIVHGVPSNKKFKVDACLGRDPKDRKKRTVVPEEQGKRAITHFTLLWTNGKYSVLSCKLETGRTHQIRVHLSFFHLPIVGDPMYGIESDQKLFSKGQLLHAYKITFNHPITQKNLQLYAPVDDYFKSSFEKIINK